jgi:hypothetical protein
MTTATLIAIASCVLGIVLVVLRRTAMRSTAHIDLSRVSVSREWLMHHQSND